MCLAQSMTAAVPASAVCITDDRVLCMATLMVLYIWLRIKNTNVTMCCVLLVCLLLQSHISFSSSPRSSRGNIDGTPATAAAALASSPSSSSSSLGSNATSQPPAGSMAAAAAAAAKLANSFQSSSSSSHAKHAAAGGGEQLTPQDAANLMLECVYEFNACVPYAGVSLVAGEGCELDPQAIAAVLALLPEELQPGLPAPVLAPDDVKQVRC